MNNVTCCVTGHRNIATERFDYVTTELYCEILLAIKDGYTHFISGFAEGVDLIFAEIVSELKVQYPITLEAAIPYRKRLHILTQTCKKLITQCNVIGVHSEEYVPSCFMKRNCFMVNQSARIIAVYDGRAKGGTAATLQYAARLGKESRIISC